MNNAAFYKKVPLILKHWYKSAAAHSTDDSIKSEDNVYSHKLIQIFIMSWNCINNTHFKMLQLVTTARMREIMLTAPDAEKVLETT